MFLQALLMMSFLLIKFLYEENCVQLLLTLEGMFLITFLSLMTSSLGSFSYSVTYVSFLTMMVLGSVLGLAVMVSMLRNPSKQGVLSKSLLKY